MRVRSIAIAVVLAACGATAGGRSEPPPSSAATTTSPATSAPTTTTTATTTSTTTTSTTTTSTTTTTANVPTTTGPTTTTTPVTTAPATLPDLRITVERNVPVPGGIPLDVFTPVGEGPFPAVVLFHGGGWVSGEKEELEPFARLLASHGIVVFNAGYEVLLHGVGFPETFEQVACAVRAAGSLAANLPATRGGLIVAGYSAGAHLGVLAALSGDQFADGCPDQAAPNIAGFAGIAGPYDSDVYPQLLVNFGASRDDDPALWAAGNPYSYISDHPPIPMLLAHGEEDFVVAPPMSAWFADALEEAGYPVEVLRYPATGHFEIADPTGAGRFTAADIAAFVRGIGD